ncbi:MAG TPA: hypothetical protein VMB24_01115 [Dehalococcoidales bacterium]|nr:hypothetical protein [Dehalococcoidales bacterium]
MAHAIKTGVKVPFTRLNARKCVCWKCPVQEPSACIKENSTMMGDVMTTKLFDPEIVPGLYCSSGTASCSDIDTERACICDRCLVFREFELGKGQPGGHYCKNGYAL